MLGAPDAAARPVSQLLHGEGFALLDVQGRWAWGYSLHDHYVGYVEAAALGESIIPTHRVAVREAILFAEPDIKSQILGTLTLGAQIAGAAGEKFLETAEGFIHLRHVLPIEAPLPDPVETAQLLLGSPYRWGGRGAGGIDCSGLVQLALAMAGISTPRDSDMQASQLGTALAEDAPLMRGDLIFFPGHVGLMADDTDLLHANAHWMAVTCEPLDDVVARLLPTHDRPITARRRL